MTAGEESLEDLEAGSVANAAVVEHAACTAESASVSRKDSTSGGQGTKAEEDERERQQRCCQLQQFVEYPE